MRNIHIYIYHTYTHTHTHTHEQYLFVWEAGLMIEQLMRLSSTHAGHQVPEFILVH